MESDQNGQCFFLTLILLSRMFLFSRRVPVRCLWPSDRPVSLSSPLPRADLWSVFKRLLETIPVRTLRALRLWLNQVIQWYLWPGMSSTHSHPAGDSFIFNSGRGGWPNGSTHLHHQHTHPQVLEVSTCNAIWAGLLGTDGSTRSEKGQWSSRSSVTACCCLYEKGDTL